MYAHGEAEHVHGLLYVGAPVAAFFLVVDAGNTDIVLLLSVGRHVECGEEGLSAVLCSCQEVDNLLLFLYDAVLLLAGVGNTFPLENAFPVAARYFDVVFQRGGVLEFCFLGHADKLLDVVPFSFEQGGVVRDGVVGAVGCGDAAYDGKFARCVFLLHPLHQIRPWTVE